MKKNILIKSLVLSLGVMVGGCAQAPDSDTASVGDAKEVPVQDQASSMPVNTESSVIEWVGTKVTGRHNGTVKLNNGTLMLTEGKLSGGSFSMDMSTIKTLDKGGAEGGLTDHLKSADFFEVEKYSTALFEITSVRALESAAADQESVPEIDQYRIANPTHEISGNLTIKGVTKGISFPAAVSMQDGQLSATAKFNINRTEWGVTYPGKPDDLIRETVHLGISLKASQPAS